MKHSIEDIIRSQQHRPFPLPAGAWRYYQEWNDALFLHWKVPFDVLRKHVPEPLTIDSIEGNCYISIVAFTMQNIRPRGLPAIRFISDFHEINVRTYVEHEGKKGVYFLTIEAEKYLSVFVARSVSGLPYRTSVMRRTPDNYDCNHASGDFEFKANFSIGAAVAEKTALDVWLTERYCLYVDRGGHVYRYDVHHKEWALKQIELKRYHVNYQLSGFSLNDQPPVLVQYSDGVQVLAWNKKRIK